MTMYLSIKNYLPRSVVRRMVRLTARILMTSASRTHDQPLASSTSILAEYSVTQGPSLVNSLWALVPAF